MLAWSQFGLLKFRMDRFSQGLIGGGRSTGSDMRDERLSDMYLVARPARLALFARASFLIVR